MRPGNRAFWRLIGGQLTDRAESAPILWIARLLGTETCRLGIETRRLGIGSRRLGIVDLCNALKIKRKAAIFSLKLFKTIKAL